MAKPLKVKKLSPSDSPSRAARRILRTRLREFYSQWEDPDQHPSPEQLHDLRIAGKRLRYSAESLRELYPDRLALFIDLLKRGQDMLGQIQDCVSQREALHKDVLRMQRRNARAEEITLLENLIAEYDQRQTTLFSQFREIWLSLTMKEFRRGLKSMISRPIKSEPKPEGSETEEMNVEKSEQPEHPLYLVNPNVQPVTDPD